MKNQGPHSEQLAETSLTDWTCSLGSAPAAVESSVPVISTLCPTCSQSLPSSAVSILYVAAPAGVAALGGAPTGGVVAVARVRINVVSGTAAPLDPSDPEVPTTLCSVNSTHP